MLPTAGLRTWWIAGLSVAVLVAVVVVAALALDGETRNTPSPGPTSTTPRVGSSTPPTVSVDRAAYVGKPASAVRTALAALNLRTQLHTIANPGGHTAGTVAALRPTGAVAVGATVTLDVWGSPPAATKQGGEKPKGKGKGKGKH